MRMELSSMENREEIKYASLVQTAMRKARKSLNRLVFFGGAWCAASKRKKIGSTCGLE
jgi:hypothetical protein